MKAQRLAGGPAAGKKPRESGSGLGSGFGELARRMQAAFPGQQSSWSPFGVGLEHGGEHAGMELEAKCVHAPVQAPGEMGEKKPGVRREAARAGSRLSGGPGRPLPAQPRCWGAQLEPSQGPAALTCLSHVLSGCAGDGDAGRTSMDAVGEFRLGEEGGQGGRERLQERGAGGGARPGQDGPRSPLPPAWSLRCSPRSPGPRPAARANNPPHPPAVAKPGWAGGPREGGASSLPALPPRPGTTRVPLLSSAVPRCARAVSPQRRQEVTAVRAAGLAETLAISGAVPRLGAGQLGTTPECMCGSAPVPSRDGLCSARASAPPGPGSC